MSGKAADENALCYIAARSCHCAGHERGLCPDNLHDNVSGQQLHHNLLLRGCDVFISDPILGHHYIAELNCKGGDLLAWSLVPRAYDGKVARVPSRAVPRKVWRQAYHLLIENP
jgi:hypothetical protein